MIPYVLAALAALLIGAVIYFYAQGRRAGADRHVAQQAEAREKLHDTAEAHLDKPTTGNIDRLRQRWRAREWLLDRRTRSAAPSASADRESDD